MPTTAKAHFLTLSGIQKPPKTVKSWFGDIGLIFEIIDGLLFPWNSTLDITMNFVNFFKWDILAL